nr:hypothetical protein CPGR_03058 [Mycolicibacter nonchromogenicus]
MFNTPGGTPAASAISPRTIASKGVYGDDLSTAVQPAASAGPTLARFSRKGKLNAVISAATPYGSRIAIPCPIPCP